MSIISRVLLLLAAGALIGSIFVPIWRIELDAPQYPEGLALQIFVDKLGGDVDIINGLNHYIGMQTLHAENFIEFTILKYIIIFFALYSLLAAAIGNKKLTYSLFWAFVSFGVIAMADFWRWEYNYGHNLDPNAAIIVPGMSYQPPLIGFKQLLNFGAFSVPDKGGYLFILSGIFMLVVVLKESAFLSRFKKQPKMALTVIVLMFLTACGAKGPVPVKLNIDNCASCKMTIADIRFATELITDKGRIYKFDDISCMMRYQKENSSKLPNPVFYVTDYLSTTNFLLLDQAILISGDEVGSPMGGNVAAFSDMPLATEHAEKWKAVVINAGALKQ